MKNIAFIDAHVHGFLKPADETRFKDNIDTLRGKGLERIIITALPYHDFDYQLKLSLSPHHIQPALSKDNHDETTLLISWIKKYGLQQVIVPFFDTRFLTTNIRETIISCKERGFMGIKGAFIPEPDRVLDIQGIPQALHLSADSYSQAQQEIISCAYELNLPLLYHVNLSRYFDWISTQLKKFPSLKVTIPHLGYSLSRIRDILNRFDTTFTDPSFLIDLLRKNNRRYLDFISTYYTRILLGSDALISNPVEEILSYVEYVSHLEIPESVRNAILRDNAYSFLSLTSC